MSQPSDTGLIRLRSAIYVASGARRDNCSGCTYSNVGALGRDYWCRLHAAPVTAGSICAAMEPPKTRKAVAA